MSAAPTGVATGIGSVPGEEPLEAMAFVVDAAPDLPHIPELPTRGPWADMIGRAVAILVDLPAEWEGDRWRSAARGGRDVRRARALLAEDLDAVEARLQGYAGRAKLQMCGPLTLAAMLELRGGAAAVSDPIATRDLAISLSEGLAAHLVDLRGRVPGAEWVVQIDEPALTSVTGGTIPRPSGWGTLAALTTQDAASSLAVVTDAVEHLGAGIALHSCATEPDWAVLTANPGSEPRAISVDLQAISLTDAALAMEEWLDAGGVLWLGVDPVSADRVAAEAAALELLEQARSVLGVPPEKFSAMVSVTPRCGFTGSVDVAGASYAGVRRLMHRLRGDSIDNHASHRIAKED